MLTMRRVADAFFQVVESCFPYVPYTNASAGHGFCEGRTQNLLLIRNFRNTFFFLCRHLTLLFPSPRYKPTRYGRMPRHFCWQKPHRSPYIQRTEFAAWHDDKYCLRTCMPQAHVSKHILLRTYIRKMRKFPRTVFVWSVWKDRRNTSNKHAPDKMSADAVFDV